MNRTLVSETISLLGEKVKLQGWVNSIRDHGKIVFIDLRDRTGLVQVVLNSKQALNPETVVEIEGTVKPRPEHIVNPNLPTGHLEIEAESLKILNQSEALPFPIDNDGYDINEEIRLKYRYVDLRRGRLQRNLKTRSVYVQAAREYLFQHAFTEIETPLLTKSTPEGSRDFVVPSRINPGKFFALPQSPQQYKQLLMTAGFERYFQIARCLRDEDPRADRGFEHTQIDLEMSFVDRADVMNLVESMTIFALEKIGAKIATKPFPIITYQEAMQKYGADKFDLRTEAEKAAGVLSFAWVVDFPFFEKTAEGGWTFTHNPFSHPIKAHEEWLLNKQNIDQIITDQYDLVCNGFEVGGGSIRSHRPELLEAVFEIMGYKKEEISAKFGHMLQAFRFGTPPHGGCAQGFERLLMAHFNEEYLREVQAFPQTGRGRTSVMDAPSPLEPNQLKELGLTLIETNLSSNTSLFDRILAKLAALNIKYDLLEHAPVYTSEEAVKVRPGLTLEQGAKALLMYADKTPILLVISAAKKVDLKLVKKQFGIKDLRMATKEEVIAITSVGIGAVPPTGSLFKTQTYVDQSLATNSQIVFNAGKHDRSVAMSYQDFLRFEQPELGQFAAS